MKLTKEERAAKRAAKAAAKASSTARADDGDDDDDGDGDGDGGDYNSIFTEAGLGGFEGGNMFPHGGSGGSGGEKSVPSDSPP